VHEISSDEYFRDQAAAAANGEPDLAFIDGMHLFEYALRDFMHLERLSRPGSLIVIDDVFPGHPAQAERKRRTRVWTGDVWKLYSCLAKMRPDLVLVPVDTQPTGLLLIAGLDRGNRVLWDRYNPIVREFREQGTPPPEVLARKGALDPADARIDAMLAVLRQAREQGTPRGPTTARLRVALEPTGNDE
jgi:hypothetical protein